MIEIKDLVKKINSERILDNISFSVKKGEILGFLGPNGAGKTTTMKIITSFWSPSSGKVVIDGIDTQKDSFKIRQKIGYLPETVPLYEDMRVRDYLKFTAEVRGVKKADIKDRVADVSRSCSLEKVLKKPIEELSKGYRQRVGLAQAIIHDPDVLILDEPTTGLDPNQIIEIRDLIKKIGQEKTVIFSTHILSEVKETCDRVIIIKDGKIVGEGTPDELTKKGNKNIIYIKIRGEKDKVVSRIKEIDGVGKVDIKDKEKEGVYGYRVEIRDNLDLREEVSKRIINNGFGVLELIRKTNSLEDVFIDLTN